MARTLEILSLDKDGYQGATVTSGNDVPVSPFLGPLPIAVNALFAGLDDESL
jgi:hypothetical protein